MTILGGVLFTWATIASTWATEPGTWDTAGVPSSATMAQTGAGSAIALGAGSAAGGAVQAGAGLTVERGIGSSSAAADQSGSGIGTAVGSGSLALAAAQAGSGNLVVTIGVFLAWDTMATTWASEPGHWNDQGVPPDLATAQTGDGSRFVSGNWEGTALSFTELAQVQNVQTPPPPRTARSGKKTATAARPFSRGPSRPCP